MSYKTAELRRFMQRHFDSDELRILLMDYFPPVFDDLATGMKKGQQAQMLLEYCHKHGKMDDLLAVLQRERPTLFNPDDYVKNQTAPKATVPPATRIPATRNPRQIFISHANQDAEMAHRLAHDLEAHGYDIWIAPDSIRPGEKWVEAINRGLEGSSMFLLLVSPEAVASRWVRTETNIAIELNHEGEMRFFPLLLKECRIPLLWRAYHHIPIEDENYREVLGKLLPLKRPLTREIVFVELLDEITSLVHPMPVWDKQDPVLNEEIDPKTGLEMVRVPEGEFLSGDDKKTVYLDEFWIAKTPVTNAAYKRFLDATPKQDVPFVDKDWAKPYNWDKGRRTFPDGRADHPVVLVSWHDAKAYAAWAGMELPTGQQWEKAARGTAGREYPWGNEWRENHCNSNESKIGSTTPVGQFSPQGDSPYGCVDMSGNVWEWTELLYKEGKDWRTLRGGSWDDSQDARALRPAAALLALSADRFNDSGFRVVVRRPPSHDR